MPRLILNADDFGQTLGINRAIQELHTAGALTSATLMANSAAFDDAVAIAQSLPTLGVGCHVVLIDGTPLSPPANIPTLLGPDGKNFRTSLAEFWLAALRGKIDPADIERETSAQIRKLQDAGIGVTHLDTHKHTHILPAVAAPLLRIAERLGIRAIRSPFEQPWSLALSHGPLLRRAQVRVMRILRPRFQALPQIRSGAVCTTDGTLGISATGRLDTSTLDALLRAMPEGTWELVCHPGYNDSDLKAIPTRLRETREVERQALLAVFAHPFRGELIHYGETAGLQCQPEPSTTRRPSS
ncbi:MAG TPA: ChbG/HpnK family deacetylase [Acidobacteriaceae bacterium]|jgi:predicted glycoside hydrolase/deacetylase ChbG (UPF0249 family)